MGITHWLLLVCAALVLSALTWCSCSWWYGRKLADLQARLEKTRQAAGLHVKQARHQIMLLQRELAERPALTKAQLKARDEAATAAARKAALEAQLNRAPAPRMPAQGFADTQPLTQPPRL